MRIGVKEPGENLKIIDLPDTEEVRYRSDVAKMYIENVSLTDGEALVEFVPLSGSMYGGMLSFGVNEEGAVLAEPLAANFFITGRSPIANTVVSEEICGTAIFIRTKPANKEEEIWDLEVTDLTDDDIKDISEMLRPDVQLNYSLLYAFQRHFEENP